MNEITFFAKTNFRNQERAFGIKTDDRRRHMYIIGKTGMGKTNLLENLVVQDIRNGYGCCYIDPHGDTAERLLKAVPAHRINDVIYFNPADQNFPIAFNVMEAVDSEYRHLVASGLVGVFKKIWADSWGPRLEYILRNAILALLEYPGSTLLGVTRILVDKHYRARVVDKVTDPVVKQFWLNEFSNWNDRVLQEVISPIQNKVGQFLSSSLIRNIVGQTQSSFDVRKVMDDQKILILNLSKGRIGEDNSALLGAMMITKIQLAAMGRVDIIEDTRKDFYLYVDEFQNFSTESFANILSEARKYRLNLILANQYIEQIDEKVRNAIFGNVGTLISFRVGAMDAEFLEKEFAPVFVQNDIVNLPKYHVYLKLMIDGIAGDAFSAKTLPPIFIEDTIENEEKIIAISRERYATSRVEVEDKIARWSGMIPMQNFQTVNKPVAQQAPQFQLRSAAQSPKFAPQAPAPSPQPQPQRQQSVAPVVAAPKAAPEPLRTQQAEVIKEEVPQPAVAESQVIQMPVAAPAQPVLAPTVENDPDYAVPEPKPDRPMYDATCDMCGFEIQVPFAPDGQRPTFCKECLKDYQRMTAKAKLDEERKAAQQQQVQPIQQPQRNNDAHSKSYRNSNKNHKERGERRVEQKVYAPQGKPMSLSQMQHIAPKQFKPQRPRPNVNLGEVRNLIKTATAQNQPQNNPAVSADDDYELDRRDTGR